MRVTRILDLFVLMLLAVLLVLPRPDATAKPALPLPAAQRERVAELQSSLLGQPDDVGARLELANLYLDGHRPDWALATLAPALADHGDDYRVQDVRAIAFADRFEAPQAFEAASAALALCERFPEGNAAAQVPPCGEGAHARLSLLHSTLERIHGLDMKNNLVLAKERIIESLHPVWIPRPRSGVKGHGGAAGAGTGAGAGTTP
jgi:hypothetical protein